MDCQLYRSRTAWSCTHLLERRHLRLSVIRRNIVHGDTLIPLQSQVDHLRDSLERSVLSLEVHVGGPIVGEIFSEGTAGAG